MKEIVKQVSNKSKRVSTNAKKGNDGRINEQVVCSEYVKMVQEKKKRNKRKLQELGLVEKTPTPQSMKTAKAAVNQSKGEKKPGARRKIMQSPKGNKRAKSKNDWKKVVTKCPFDHNLFDTNYCEEDDKRYVGQDYDLHNVKCQGCKKCFSLDGKKDSVVPTLKEPIYLCQGRQKHHCTFSYCYSWFQS